MMLMFSKGRILGGKPFLVASRKQKVLNSLVLYCAVYLCFVICYHMAVTSIRDCDLRLLV